MKNLTWFQASDSLPPSPFSNKSAVDSDGLFENKGNQTFVAGNKDRGHNLQITESEKFIQASIDCCIYTFWKSTLRNSNS